MARRTRLVTESEAWCNKGQHMVAHAGFAKGQSICRECRKCYNLTSNYSHGKTCSQCGARVANTNVGGHCQGCYRLKQLAERGSAPVRRYVTTQGYVRLTSHYWHPNCDRRGEVLEHVKVMSEMLGRPLAPGENVHHINGVRARDPAAIRRLAARLNRHRFSPQTCRVPSQDTHRLEPTELRATANLS